MDDPAKTGAAVTANSPSASETSAADEDDFAKIRRRTRHPALALAAAVLALFLIVKMRFDLAFLLAAGGVEEVGDARSILSSPRGLQVLAEGRNRRVRIRGTPDRESALQLDTQGSWTFTQFFRILGTDSRLFVHRREDPLPAFRAEQDVFEGRLIRFADLSFEDAIRAYFTSHVSATHFFRTEDIVTAVAGGARATVALRDLGGDEVTLGENDILAIDLRHPEELEIGLATKRFHDAETARVALVARGARVTQPGRPQAERQVWRIAVTPSDRDAVLDAIAALDAQADIREVRETVKVRLMDLAVAIHTGEAGAAAPSLVIKPRPGGTPGATVPAPVPRQLTSIDSIRTLATVQIPGDAYLIVEGETPREHLPEAAIALVLIVFASVNLVGLVKGLRA
jgi:hypothetical protein